MPFFGHATFKWCGDYTVSEQSCSYDLGKQSLLHDLWRNWGTTSSHSSSTEIKAACQTPALEPFLSKLVMPGPSGKLDLSISDILFENKKFCKRKRISEYLCCASRSQMIPDSPSTKWQNITTKQTFCLLTPMKILFFLQFQVKDKSVGMLSQTFHAFTGNCN